MTENVPDPLRTFDLNQAEWLKIRNAVEDEGFDEWDQWAPAIVAAIELGYMDNHLQMLGRHLKGRYMHLKNSDSLPILYSATGAQKALEVSGGFVGPGSDGTWANYADAVAWVEQRGLMLPSGGVKPLRKYQDFSELARGEFKAKGYVFNKDEFIDRYFVSPVPVRPLTLFHILKVDRVNFAVRSVAHPTGKGVGAERSFNIERQFKFYNVPAS